MKISENYESISSLINSAQERGVDIVNFITQMRTDLGNSEIPSVDISRQRLEKNIDPVFFRLNSNNVFYTEDLLKFVGNLQKYITEKYGSVDTFLSDNNIKVGSTFADISKEAGYPISSSNIILDIS